ncbi:hypothetical protein DXT89_01115 [Agrobacterium vitis]|uniref:Uncharacterized protein n=1 Tax=Agrobacterium vitis TaxID=373 RepID=A0A368NXR0_AGRVI|nr:hypothetical protein DXM22_02610 [Agrobacterium vitis]KAA3532003.1 hypothetical protein DXT89_01115 [Agrobacterium vitis]RCU55128.1 hypothetical protein ASB66_009260 [Agrobacterium vitis]
MGLSQQRDPQEQQPLKRIVCQIEKVFERNSQKEDRVAPPHPASAALGGPLPAGERRTETLRFLTLLPSGEKVAAAG